MSPRTVLCLSLLVCFLCLVPASAEDAADQSASKSEATTYVLRYKFQPSEVMRWKAVHQALVRTTVSGTTQTAETRSESIKVWQVSDVDTKTGQATFVHSVDSVDMRQSVSGRQDVRYNSLNDAVAPAEFEEVAKAVGVPLSVIVLDSQGHIIKRHEERAQPNANPGEMTVPLPEESVAVGENWSFPHDANVRQKDGSIKPVKTRQEFTLTEVDKGIATIRVETIVLTPIRDPALEAQLIQHVTDGTVRFDIAAGRVVGQQTDIDKRVIGFQGEASSLHYVTRFTEELMPQPSTTAGRKKPGPASTAAPGPRGAKAQPSPSEESATEAIAAAGDSDAPSAAGSDSSAAANAKTATGPSGTTPAGAAAAGGKPSATGMTPPKTANKSGGKPSNKQATSKTKPKPKTGNKPSSGQQQRR